MEAAGAVSTMLAIVPVSAQLMLVPIAMSLNC